MKRRNIYIASTLVLALVLMVGFPTSARPQFGNGMVKTPNSYVKIMSSFTHSLQMVERINNQTKIPNFVVPQPKVNSVASIHLLQLPEAPCPKPAKTAQPVKASPLLKVAPVPAPLAAKAAKEKKRKKTIETIITSDGSTLLGADDKTGCTILVTLIETILNDKKLKHGDLYFVFSQNEDIGRAADYFQEEYVCGQPDIVIDVDGNDPTAFSVENFTAAARTYRFHGKNAHPGNGFYTKYGDALTAASYFIGQLPPETHPSASKDKEGYIHCYSVSHPTDELGNEITKDYLVKVRLRYFDVQEGDTFRQLLDEATELTAKAFPNVMIDADPEVMQYENVAYTMYPGLDDLIIEAAEKEGVKLTPRSERGGTTAAMLATKGQKGGPCLYSGQQAEHSVYEWTCAEDMYQMVMVARSIIETVANQ